MQAPKIDYTAFNADNLVKTPPQQKQSQPKLDPNNPNAPPQAVTYYEIPLSYKYTVKDREGKDVDVIADLYVQGPELFSPSGIQSKEMSGKQVHSLFTSFDVQSSEIRAFVGTDKDAPGMMDKLYHTVVRRIDECKGSVGLGRMQNTMMIEGVTTYPIHWPRDSTTSQVIPGKNPSKYFSLFSYGQGYGQRRTLFCTPISDENGRPQNLDWELLRGVEMKYIPLFHFKKIFIGGGKASIQFDIVSAVVTHVVKANTETNQTDTIESLKRNDTLTKNLREQIAALNLALDKSKQDDKAASKSSKNETPVKQSTATSQSGSNSNYGSNYTPYQQSSSSGYPPHSSSYQQQGHNAYTSPYQQPQGSNNGGMPTTLSSMLQSGPVMTGFPSTSQPPHIRINTLQ